MQTHHSQCYRFHQINFSSERQECPEVWRARGGFQTGVRVISIYDVHRLSLLAPLRPPAPFTLFVRHPAEKGLACRTICVVSAPWTLALPPPSPKMKKTQLARLLFTHPNEFRSLLQYWLWHEPKRDITALGEHGTSGYDRKSMRRCWEFLDQTSRSFASVIKELEGDLARVVRRFLRNLLYKLNAFYSAGMFILPCTARTGHP